MYHNGRGTQESIFGELKSQSQMDYIAVRRLYGNQMYILAAIMAHNLNRDIQTARKEKNRGTTEKRASLWEFEELSTIRQSLIQRAGRLTHPQGKLTLTMSANKAVKKELLFYLDALKRLPEKNKRLHFLMQRLGTLWYPCSKLQGITSFKKAMNPPHSRAVGYHAGSADNMKGLFEHSSHP